MASVKEVKPSSEKVQEHLRAHNVKKGVERLDRRSRTGVSGAPKKGGRGGKFTWEGGRSSNLADLQPPLTVLDHKDPNYQDDEEEQTADV